MRQHLLVPRTHERLVELRLSRTISELERGNRGRRLHRIMPPWVEYLPISSLTIDPTDANRDLFRSWVGDFLLAQSIETCKFERHPLGPGRETDKCFRLGSRHLDLHNFAVSETGMTHPVTGGQAQCVD